MPKPKLAHYADLRDDLKMGDLILYSGKETISNVIKLVTSSRWSHIGMVFDLPEYDFVTVWEATTLSNARDLTSGKFGKGVQLIPLSERVRIYDGEIAMRRLQPPVTAEQVIALVQLRRQLRGKPYEEDNMGLIRSAYDGTFGTNQEDLTSVFCSELVAEAYQSMGLLSESLPSNEYTPADFSSETGLQLEGDAYLHDEVFITMDSSNLEV